MNDQPKKRSNPFDKIIYTEPVEEKEDVVVETKPQQPIVEQIPQTQYNNYVPEYNYNTQYQQPVQKTPKKTQKPQYIQPMDAPKEKYTATMDVSLRRKIKIYCATNGKMFSEFIEDACREKLAREGIK